MPTTQYHPFCGFECYHDYHNVVVASDVSKSDTSCPTCGETSANIINEED